MIKKPGYIYTHIITLGFALGFSLTPLLISADGASISDYNAGAGVQIEPEALDPAQEQLDEVSEPVGELSEPLTGSPTETLDSVSETAGEASENPGSLTETPETLDEATETAHGVEEQLDQVSETAEQASENIPITPEGDGSGLEYDSREAEMPLGDREAEGRGIGE